MPRQRTCYNRETYHFPDDFTERLKRFQEECGLTWSEIARRLGTYRYTVWRWQAGRGRPNMEHMMGLLDLAQDLGLAHLFTEEVCGANEGHETQKRLHTSTGGGGPTGTDAAEGRD